MVTKKDLYEYEWENFQINSRETTLYSNTKNKKYFIKIEIKENPSKNLNVLQEYDVIKYLKDSNCVTCPKPYLKGSMSSKELNSLTGYTIEHPVNFMVTEYLIENDVKYNLSDIILSMIEQKNLGIYQGDIKPDNVRYNKQTGVCYIVDYDQSIMLDKKEKNLNSENFLKMCDNYDLKKYKIGNWLRHYENNKNFRFNRHQVENLLVDGSLNIQGTSIIKMQNTTNTPDGLYHSISHRDIFLNGRRDLLDRSRLLELVKFKENEHILDVGCNQGLLSFYLDSRGCNVEGIDIDYHIILAAKITNNIIGKNVNFENLNIDKIKKLKKYDTIMLFSVLHHTINQNENFKKINDSCNRIIIEMRLNENGSQPVGKNNSWVKVAQWNFKSLDHLVEVFKNNCFPDFEFSRKIGECDKGRMILEFVRVDNV